MPTVLPAGFNSLSTESAHGERGGVSAACRQSAEYRLAGERHVKMEGLRIKLAGEGFDALLLDTQPPGAVDLPYGEVLEILLGHQTYILFNRASCGSEPPTPPKKAPPATAAALVRNS